MGILATARDPDGRTVELTHERWAHIVGAESSGAGHPELREHQTDVMRAVATPTFRARGRATNEEWFYLEDAGPSRYLKVVVAFTGEHGRIVTAFARRAMP